jgi:hypothetical protein
VRDRVFDTGALSVEGGEVVGLLPRPRDSQQLMLSMGFAGEGTGAPARLGVCTLSTRRTGQAIRWSEGHMHRGAPMGGGRLGPADPASSLWADDVTALPVDLEALNGEPVCDTPLPLAVEVERPDEINLVARLAACQIADAGVPAIDKLLGREHMALGQRLLNGEQLFDIMGRSRGGAPA